jgi:hypothetical protein
MKRLLGCGIVLMCAFVPMIASAEEKPASGAIDGNTGLPIPCVCRFRDRAYRVGDQVCMSTPNNGVVMARCGLSQNVTTWLPTNQSCAVSRRDGTAART